MESQGRTLVELFRDVVHRFPDRVAVTAPDGSLTYRELSQRASELACRLRAAGVAPGSIVALLAPRTTHMLVGILGILGAGAAYLPIDPNYPPERVAWTIKDSEASVVVTTSALSAAITDQYLDLMLVDRLANGDIEPAPISGWPASADNSDESLAYVIYTSGSSGVPKGVQVDHRNVIRLFGVTQEQFAFDENDVWAAFHSSAFDFSVWEIWGALLFGGRLVIVPLKTAQDPARFRDLLHAQQVTILNQTPSAFRRLAAADALSPQRLGSLRVVIFGGERLDPPALRDWMDRYGDQRPRLVNMYGITEATVHASFRLLTHADLATHGPSPIGQPLSDLTFHVLGDDGLPVAEGEAGELYIAGAGVARGYLRRPDATAERFTEHADPAGTIHRRYRTGDRVAALPGGDYGYLGRNDDQLQIRGYRVEPAEVEAVIIRHPDVSATVVTSYDYGGGDVRIVAFLASGRVGESLAPELGELAAASLPPHMRPSAYVTLRELPLTLNGKVDKASLPSPTAGMAVPPARLDADSGMEITGTQGRIARIWQAILQVPRVEPDADFFDLGGTSLSLVRMFTQVNEECGTDLDITVLLDGVTVGSLARSVDAALLSPTSPA